MLDDLRNSAQEPYQEEEEVETTPGFAVENEPAPAQPFLGMNAPQRFIVALILFMMVCVLGSMCLIVFGRINVALPF